MSDLTCIGKLRKSSYGTDSLLRSCASIVSLTTDSQLEGMGKGAWYNLVECRGGEPYFAKQSYQWFHEEGCVAGLSEPAATFVETCQFYCHLSRNSCQPPSVSRPMTAVSALACCSGAKINLTACAIQQICSTAWCCFHKALLLLPWPWPALQQLVRSRYLFK